MWYARKKEEYELFSDEDGEKSSTPTLSYEQYQRLEDFLKKKKQSCTSTYTYILLHSLAYWKGLWSDLA